MIVDPEPAPRRATALIAVVVLILIAAAPRFCMETHATDRLSLTDAIDGLRSGQLDERERPLAIRIARESALDAIKVLQSYPNDQHARDAMSVICEAVR